MTLSLILLWPYCGFVPPMPMLAELRVDLKWSFFPNTAVDTGRFMDSNLAAGLYFFFLLNPKIDQWQFSNFPYHSSSTFPVILNRILPACDHIADTEYPPPNTSTNRSGCSYSQIFPSILSFRHCSKLNPSSLSQTSIFPVFIFLSLPCWMYVFDTEASGIMEWLVRGLYFLPMLLGWCIIVAEEVIWHW